MGKWKPLQEIYPGADKGYFSEEDYVPLLQSFGYEILLQVDEDDYQGDSIVIFRDTDSARYGYLMFG